MSAQRSITRDNPPTAIANDGKTVLKRHRVDGVIYARTIREARSRLREVTYSGALDDAVIKTPRRGKGAA